MTRARLHAVTFRYVRGPAAVCQARRCRIKAGELRWVWRERNGDLGVGCRCCIFEHATVAGAA